MKKKIFLLLTVCFLLASSFIPSFAQENNSVSVTPSPSPAPIQYDLPYPGLLPDNFLYKVKTLRDRLVSFLISDPLKKAEFNILQADKRYNASLYLYHADLKKEELIVSTISKADNYMEEAVGQLVLAKEQGQGQKVKDLTNTFLLSNRKHLEILQEIQKSASVFLKKQLKQEEKRITEIEVKVKKEFHVK